jgi:hypothetical protein
MAAAVERPLSSPRVTPPELDAWICKLRMGPMQNDATLHRHLVADNGTIGIAGRRTSVGAAHTGTTVTAIRDGNHVTVYHLDGRPIGHLHLEPDNKIPHPNIMINNS